MNMYFRVGKADAHKDRHIIMAIYMDIRNHRGATAAYHYLTGATGLVVA